MTLLSRLLPAVLLLAASSAWAQTAQITGRIIDPSEAPVAAAQVTVIHTDTGARRVVSTGPEGYFTAALLPRGRYEVSAESQGFRTLRQTEITLDEGQVLRLDFRMQIGQVSESIEVTAEAGLLSTEQTSISTVVPNQKVLDLPLAGRNPLALANLVPGVRPVGQFGGLTVSSFDGSRVSIGGGPPSTNNFMIDGVAAENFASGGIQITLSPDATEEMRVITRNPSAEYGRTGGGVINIVSRAGTNRWTGALFNFHRNRALNANDFFTNSAGRDRPQLVYNQFGATVGGPIQRDKTFFFFNWEAVKQRSVAQTFRSVPTELQRRGDFSQTLDARGQRIVIYDPATTRPDPSRPGRYLRDAFPGNVIPSNRISPVARAVLDYYPLSNQPGVAFTQAQNFFAQGSAPLDKDVYGLRIDRNLTASRRIFGRYTYDNTFRGAPNYYGNIAETTTSDLNFVRHSGAVNYTESLTPTLLLEARAGINRYVTPRTTRSYGFDVNSLGLPASLNSQIQLPVFPRFTPGDVDPIGAPSDDQLMQANDSYTAAGSVMWIRSEHAMKFGGEYRLYRANNSQMCGQILSFDFGRGFTQGPDPIVAAQTAGYGVATFLLGTPSAGQINRCPPATYQVPHYALFAQDDWKVTPRLTLNLGLRWELEGAYTDRFNAFSMFDPDLRYRAGDQDLVGGLIYPGVNGQPRGNRDVSYKDFAPRAGLSYQLTSRTVARAAYGIYYLPTTGLLVRLGQTGFSIQTPLVGSIDGGLTPYRTLGNPFPEGVLEPPGASLGPLTGIGTNISGSPRTLRRGYSQQWNVNIQQELSGNWIVEAGYMGNRGVGMPASRSYRYLPEAALALGTQLQELVDNPYASLVSTGPLAQPRVTRATLLNHYPQFLGVTGFDNWADSIYHAGTLRVEKRFSAGLSVLAAYTWSKLIDNNIGNGGNGFADGGSNGVQNWDNLRAERAVSTSDLPHRLVMTASYELPFARSGHALYKALAGGWQVNSILTLQSGNVISVTAPAPAFGGSRPNMVGDPSVDNPNIDGWLNRDAFEIIPPFTYGNAPRNLPRTRTDGLQNLDLSLFKNFAIKERFRLQLRGEAFNLTNTPTFGNPGTSISAGNFGVIRSLATNTGPRQIQVALKLYF